MAVRCRTNTVLDCSSCGDKTLARVPPDWNAMIHHFRETTGDDERYKESWISGSASPGPPYTSYWTIQFNSGINARCQAPRRHAHSLQDSRRTSSRETAGFQRACPSSQQRPWFAGLLSPQSHDRLRALLCPQSSLLVFGVSVGYQLDQVVVGVTHVQTSPGALGA